MVSHALSRQVAFFIETNFVVGGPTNWAVNGTYIYCIDPDISGVVQESVENANNRLRPRAAHPNILTLKNSSASFGLYMHASPAAAAEGAAAVTYHVAELIYAALGGRDLGYAAAVVSSELEDGDGLVLADIDPQRVASVRAQLPSLSHRRSLD